MFLGHRLRVVIRTSDSLVRIVHSCEQRNDSQVLFFNSLDHFVVLRADKLLFFVSIVSNEIDSALFFVDSGSDRLALDHLLERWLYNLNLQLCFFGNLREAKS